MKFSEKWIGGPQVTGGMLTYSGRGTGLAIRHEEGVCLAHAEVTMQWHPDSLISGGFLFCFLYLCPIFFDFSGTVVRRNCGHTFLTLCSAEHKSICSKYYSINLYSWTIWYTDHCFLAILILSTWCHCIGQATLRPFWSQLYVPFCILFSPHLRCEHGPDSGLSSSFPLSSRYLN